MTILVDGKQMSAALSSGSSGFAADAMSIAAMRTAEQNALEIGVALGKSCNAEFKNDAACDAMDEIKAEHEDVLQKQRDQEKLITDLSQENLSLRGEQFDLLKRIEALERNVRARASPSPLRGGMQIFVKTLAGKTITINDIEGSDTMATLKERVLKKTNTPMQPRDIKLICSGKQLNDNYTINDYNINTVFVLLRLRGGIDAGQLREGLMGLRDRPINSSILG